MWITALESYLAEEGFGVIGETLFHGMMVDLKQETPVTALNEFKGTTREVMGGDGVDRPMLQVAVRAPSYDQAHAHIMAIRTFLRHMGATEVFGQEFIYIIPDGVLKDLNRDAKGRQMFTADFEVNIPGE